MTLFHEVDGEHHYVGFIRFAGSYQSSEFDEEKFEDLPPQYPLCSYKLFTNLEAVYSKRKAVAVSSEPPKVPMVKPKMKASDMIISRAKPI
jgi:hypothetical protein